MKEEILEVLKFYLDFADPEDLDVIADKINEKIQERLSETGAKKYHL